MSEGLIDESTEQERFVEMLRRAGVDYNDANTGAEIHVRGAGFEFSPLGDLVRVWHFCEEPC